MAKKSEATLLVKVKTQGKEKLKTIRDGLLSLDAASNLLSKSAELVKNFGKAIFDMALQGAKIKEVREAFKNLASSQGQDAEDMLDSMRRLSKGTVDDLTLMQQANNALLLGLPVEKFDEMLNIARAASKATGESMEFMLTSIVTGLGRGSKLILDNLGIVVDTNKAYEKYAKTLKKTAAGLSDAEKKQAFINEALAIGSANANTLSGSTDTLNDSWGRLKATLSNIVTTIGEELEPMFKLFVDSANVGLDLLTGQMEERLEEIRIAKEGAENKALEHSKKTNKLDLEDWDKVWEEKKNTATTMEDLVRQHQSKNREDDKTQTVTLNKEAQEEITRDLIKSDKIRSQHEMREEEAKVKYVEQINFQAFENMAGERSRLFNISNEDVLSTALKGSEELAKTGVQLMTDILVPGAGGVAGEIFSILTQDAESFQGTLENLFSAEWIDNIIDNLTTFIEKSPELAEKFIEAVISNMPEFSTALAKAVGSPEFAANMAAAIGRGTVKGFKDVANDIANTLTKAFKDAMKALGDLGGVLSSGGGGDGGTFGKIKKSLGFAEGGKVPGVTYLANGGMGSDIVPAMLTPGEFVVNRNDAGNNLDLLERINSGEKIQQGSTINITVNGGMLGTESEAREFAKVIDEKLLELRQDNESLAFDSDVV